MCEKDAGEAHERFRQRDLDFSQKIGVGALERCVGFGFEDEDDIAWRDARLE
jgi:hypothetical protein